MIIKDLFVNLTIVISILFLYANISTYTPLNRETSLIRKIVIGIAGGIFCNILMHFSIHIETTLIDLRHVPIILLAYFGGAFPSILAMILVIIGRFIIGVNLSSYVSVLFIVSITLFSIFVSSREYSRRIKIIQMLTFSNIAFTCMLLYLIKDLQILAKLISTYWVVSYISGYVSFFVLDFIRNSQILLDKYRKESTMDGLTGLNNVRKFDEVFNLLINELDTNNQRLSILFLDIDFFKKINDTYGHSEGDLVLKELGLILKKCTRSFDFVSRNGGEEFSVLLPDCSLRRALEIAENIRQRVEANKFKLSGGGTIHVTISIGVASYIETTEDPTMLIKDADKALYLAKNSGRNQVCHYLQKA